MATSKITWRSPATPRISATSMMSPALTRVYSNCKIYGKPTFLFRFLFCSSQPNDYLVIQMSFYMYDFSGPSYNPELAVPLCQSSTLVVPITASTISCY